MHTHSLRRSSQYFDPEFPKANKTKIVGRTRVYVFLAVLHTSSALMCCKYKIAAQLINGPTDAAQTKQLWSVDVP